MTLLAAAALTVGVLLAEPAAPVTPEAAAELARRGDHEGAAELYARLVAADPEDWASRVGRVRELLRADRWLEALDEARGYAGARPGSVPLRAVLGEALFRAGRFAEADETLSPVVAALREPDHGGVDARTLAHALVALGRLRAAEGRHGVAAGYLNHALELAPDDRRIVYESAGAAPNRAEIVRRLERYLEMSDGDDPNLIEAARGKVRFYGILGERRVWVVEHRPDRVEVPLAALGDGAGNVIGYTLDVALGKGKPVRLLLDSGSTGLFLLERLARKRGFEALSEETAFGGGGGKRHRAPRGLFPVLRVDDLEFSSVLATTTRHEIEPTGRFQGLLGLSSFEGYHVTLDLAAKRLVLDRTLPADPDVGAPYWDVSGQMLVEASTASGETGLFLLDTGATSTNVSLSLAERTPGAVLGDPVRIRGFGGNLAGTRSVRGMKVVFQDRRTPAYAINATDLSLRSYMGGVEISGMVGLDLLAGRRVVVDTRTRRVAVLEPERRRKKKP